MTDYKQFSDSTNKAIGRSILLLVAVIIIGTVGYMYIDDLKFLDALYMTIITISTVGFREVGPHELSDEGKIFTIFLILISLGILAYFGSNILRFIINGELKHYLNQRKMEKLIQKLKNHVIIVGYGRNGEQAVSELRDNSIDCVIIEYRDNVISRIEEDPQLLYIKGDATQEDVLERARVREAKAILITLPDDADNVFVVLSVRNMNPGIKIISRSSEMRSVKKLHLAGANNVIMPELIGGQQMAKLVSQPDIVEFMDNVLLQSKSDVQLVEIPCDNISKNHAGKSISSLKIREHSGANIVGMKLADMSYIINPEPSMMITPDVKLFILGNPHQIESFRRWIESEM